jgi:hypothetical protein
MAMLKINDPSTITIKILADKKRVKLHFETPGTSPYKSIEFELASILALGFASETLKLLTPGNTPSPASRTPSSGRVKLRGT